MTMSYSFLTRLVIFGVVLFPVIEGKLIRPEFIFPALPLIKQFVEAVILRMLMFQLMQLSEMLVAAGRIQVDYLILVARKPVFRYV